jgi:hypothetical protein
MAQTDKIVTMTLFILLAVCQAVWAMLGGPGSTLDYVLIACVLAAVLAWQLRLRRADAGHDKPVDDH